jgi:hypothetical protein
MGEERVILEHHRCPPLVGGQVVDPRVIQIHGAAIRLVEAGDQAE